MLIDLTVDHNYNSKVSIPKDPFNRTALIEAGYSVPAMVPSYLTGRFNGAISWAGKHNLSHDEAIRRFYHPLDFEGINVVFASWNISKRRRFSPFQGHCLSLDQAWKLLIFSFTVKMRFL